MVRLATRTGLRNYSEGSNLRLREAIGLEPGGDLAAAIERMNAEIGIPSGLTEMGIVEDDIPGLIEYALKDLSARSNPRRCSAEDFEKMIRESL